MSASCYKRINLELEKEDWEDLLEAKTLSRAVTIAQVLRESLRRHLAIERERFRLEQERKGKA